MNWTQLQGFHYTKLWRISAEKVRRYFIIIQYWQNCQPGVKSMGMYQHLEHRNTKNYVLKNTINKKQILKIIRKHIHTKK